MHLQPRRNLGLGTGRDTLIHGEECVEGKKPGEERLQIRPESIEFDGGSDRDGQGQQAVAGEVREEPGVEEERKTIS